MLNYRPVSYRLPVTPPRVVRQAPKYSYQLSQSFAGVFGWPGYAGDGIRLIFHGTTAALGYHVWITEKGFWKYFGLFLALGQTAGALCDLISVGKRIAGTHPPEEK